MSAKSAEYSSPSTPFLILSLVLAAGGIGGAVYYRWHPLIGYAGGVNAATLLLYGYDKAIAGGTKTRVPERVLHIVAFAGGTPAAFVAQALFRHKTSKAPFQRTFWILLVLQAAVFGVAFWTWRHPPAWWQHLLRG